MLLRILNSLYFRSANYVSRVPPSIFLRTSLKGTSCASAFAIGGKTNGYHFHALSILLAYGPRLRILWNSLTARPYVEPVRMGEGEAK
jgi:hypothetical protein